MRQVGLIAPVAKFIAKPCWCERLAQLGDKKRQVLRWGGSDDFSQIRIKRNVDVNWIAILILGLSELNPTIFDVLRAETNDIFPATSRI